MASIPKSNVSNGNTIQAADVKNILDCLDGTTAYDLTLKGTLNITGSVITGSISNATSASYSISSSRAVSSSYSVSSSYVASSSFASTASFVNSSSYSLSSSYSNNSQNSRNAITSSTLQVESGSIIINAKNLDFVNDTVMIITGSNGATVSILAYGRINQAISGTLNTFFGTEAGAQSDRSTADRYNTAIGYFALNINDTGIHNTAIGALALENSQTSSNIGIGYQAGRKTTTGHDNTYIGNSAGSGSISGRHNIAIGNEALKFNTSSSNVAVGYQAGLSNTIGRDNTYVGFQAGASGSGNHSNVAIGYMALSASISSSNTAIGWRAGSTNTTGWNNTFIGNGAAGVAVGSSHSITLGNNQIATLRCQQTAITALSDRRDKTEIAPLQLGLEFINELNPVTFTWDMRDGGKVGIPDLGFIAQELQEVEDRFDVSEHTQLVYKENPNKLEATWGRLLPIAIKAIQELSQENKELKERLNKAGL